MVRGGTQTNTQTQIHINDMTRPGLGAGPTENRAKIIRVSTEHNNWHEKPKAEKIRHFLA